MSQRKRNLPRGWYPFDAKDCQREIESFIKGWSFSNPSPGKGVGGVIPHAGWYFSGKLAARVFSLLKSRSKPELIVLYGGHLRPEERPRMVTDKTWETPLGEVELHTDFARALMERFEIGTEHPNSGDNTMEIHLPMIRYFFPGTKLLAIRSPASLKAKGLGEAVAELAREEGISILSVGSTDLTHYGPNYGFTPEGVGRPAAEWVKRENDHGFIHCALEMDIEGLLKNAQTNENACSAGAAASAIATCRSLGAEKGVLVDYYTSYEIMPDDSFVGYGGIVY